MNKHVGWIPILLACLLVSAGLWVLASGPQKQPVQRDQVAELHETEEIAEETAEEEAPLFDEVEAIGELGESAEEMDDYVETIQNIAREPKDVIVLAISELRTICEMTNTMEKLPEILIELFKDCTDQEVRNAAYIAVAEAQIYTLQYDKAIETYKGLIKENLQALAKEAK